VFGGVSQDRDNEHADEHGAEAKLVRCGFGRGSVPRQDSDDVALLQKQGDAHEASHLVKLKASGVSVVEIAQATCAALAKGPQIVFQGAFLADNWGGWSDFLERVERPSQLGAFSYEVTDTKLKRRPHPKHVLQLVLYSDLLTQIQGTAPEFAHVELGNGTRARLRLADYQAYARMARSRLESFLENPGPTRPVPCADCSLCRWGDHCDSVWQAEDSLFNVANISGVQVKKLENAGIRTMESLAGLTQSVIDSLQFEMPLHHRDEELGLFPLIEKRALPVDNIHDILARLALEHATDESFAAELLESLEGLSEGRKLGNPEMVGYMLRSFFESYRRHIIWENTIVIPLARARLTIEDLTQLSQTMIGHRQ